MRALESLREAMRIRRLKYGVLLLFSLALFSLLVMTLSPFEPTEVSADRLAKPLTPSDKGWPYLLGTDSLGRDVLVRVSHAFFLDVGVGLAVIAIAGSVGLALGLVAGYVGGPVDSFIMRLMDILISIPGFMLAIAIAAVLGPSITNAVIAVAVVTVPIYARLVRGVTLSVRESLFVLAALEAGLPTHVIMIKHVLPHVLPYFLTQAMIELGNAVLYVAGLSFIGLGAQEPTPEWGLMIAAGRRYLREAWWYPVFPGVFLFLTVLAFNLIGDGLRDYLDPKRRLRA